MANHNCRPGQILEGNVAISKREHLELIRIDGKRWLTLYKCRECGGYWEETYDISKGAYMAGGVPVLTCLSKDDLQRWNIELP